jgi:dTMP kinase
MAARGLFVTLEGGEGAGKSTQALRLRTRLESLGRRVVQVREPGGTKFGEDLRALLLASTKIATRTEMLLFMAARSELVDKVIGPALESGIDVVCDRFIDSTVAYQGYGRGLDLKLIDTVNAAVIDACVPDLTVLLDVDPEVGLTRGAEASAGDAIEGHWQAGLSLETPSSAPGPRDDDEAETKRPPSNGRRVGGRDRRFHERVRKGYLALAKAEPSRWLVLDARASQDAIAEAIWGRVEVMLASRATEAE